MANARKKISELTALESASLDTVIVGVDNGTTYKIELDVLADAVTSRVNILDRERLESLELVTSSFETKGRNIISGSSQLTSSYDERYIISGSITETTWDNIANKPAGIVSQSTDLTSLNSFTASQQTLNTAFNNGISARLQTSSFELFSSSVHSEIIAATNEQSFNGLISGSSQLTSSYDSRYVLSGSITQTTWDNIENKPIDIISSSAQISDLGFISSSHTDITSLNSFTSSQSTLNTAFSNGISARLQTSSFNEYTSSQEITNGNLNDDINILYDTKLNTSSFNEYTSSNDQRISSLEATIISGSANYTQVLGNRRTGITSVGTSIISGSITTTGNPVQIMVTGDANPIVTSWARLQIFRDGNGIGNVIQVENSSNLNVPYCLNVIDTPPAGTYTYSMRTVDSMSGQFDFGEYNGPLLTAVELKTNTNLPSTNNTFTGANRFNGGVIIGGASGDEGGEIQLVNAQTNSTLAGSAVSVDIYQNRLRIFEGGGDARGVHIDLSKTPGGVAGELVWKRSGIVNAGTFVQLDNLKVTVTSSGNRGLSVGAVSTNFTANVSGMYGLSGGSGGSAANNVSYTTTASTSAFAWHFPSEGDGSTYTIVDKTNSRMYRVTLMIGSGYNNNFISIERLY